MREPLTAFGVVVLASALLWIASSTRARTQRALMAALVVAAFFLLLAFGPAASAPAPSIPPADPATAVDYWRTRGNPYRARHAARLWAGAEAQQPAGGHLSLAALDAELGRKDRAETVLRRVVALAPDPNVRAEAERRLADLARTK